MKDTSNILYIYTRVSSEISVKKDNSLPAQKLAGIKRAKELGLAYEVHEEKGKSASEESLDNRPVLRKLLEMCDDKLIKHLFVSEFDRLTRNPFQQLYIKRVLRENAILLHTTGQTIDMQDDEQEFMSDIITLLSQREIRIKNKRVKRTLLESARKGKVGGGVMIPYGFKKGEDKILQIDADEAEIVKRIFEMSLLGMGSPAIAKTLNTEGVPTRARKALKNGIKVKNKYTGFVTHKTEHELVWKPGTVIGMLKNTIYKGDRRYKENTFKVPAIITPETWSEVQDNLFKNRAYSGGTKKHFYLLKGLLRCGRCNNNLYGYVKENRSQYVYMCSSKRESFCGMKSINIKRLDNLVWDAAKALNVHIQAVVEEMTKDSDRQEKIQNLEKKIIHIEKHLEKLKGRKDNLVNLYMSARVDLSTFDSKNADLEKETREHEIQKAALVAELNTVKAPKDFVFAGLTFEKLFYLKLSMTDEERRKILTGLVKNVEVNYDEKTLLHNIKVTLKLDNMEIQRSVSSKPNKDKSASDRPYNGSGKDLGYDVRIGDSVFIQFKYKDDKPQVHLSGLPPAVKESRRSRSYHGWSGNELICSDLQLLLVFEMRNVTGKYHLKSEHKLLSRKLLQYDI